MGCGASAPVRPELCFDDCSKVSEALSPSSFHSWTMIVSKQGPNPPERKLHERHVGKLNTYLRELERSPESLRCDVSRKRLEHLHRKLQQQQAVGGQVAYQKAPKRMA